MRTTLLPVVCHKLLVTMLISLNTAVRKLKKTVREVENFSYNTLVTALVHAALEMFRHEVGIDMAQAISRTTVSAVGGECSARSDHLTDMLFLFKISVFMYDHHPLMASPGRILCRNTSL